MKYDITILGAGESGIGAALLGKAKGLEVFVSDNGTIDPDRKKELEDAAIPYEEQGHTHELILQSGELIKSPGIPDHVPLLVEAKDAGISVINELEFAFRYTKAKMVGITGTNGKTTTTLLTYHLLKSGGLNVGLAGNVGHSLAKQVIDDQFEYYVVEISSFQLDGMYDFKADIAILLNITPDHLDRYENDFQKYVEAKFRILQNLQADDTFIYWEDDPSIEKQLKSIHTKAKLMPLSINNELEQGAFIAGKEIVLKDEICGASVDLQKLPLIGKHNLINSMTAITVARNLGITTEDIIQGLETFNNAPHRLEKVAVIHEVNFINDSKATNVNAVYYALEGLESSIIWIAGGVDKGNDYRLIDQLVRQKVKCLICLGTDNEKLITYFDGKVPSIYETQDIGEAVKTAQALADAGDTVLLSPACASFDLFNNYEHRGDRFREEVINLKSQNGHKKEAIT